jgi:hypothetical protein
MALSNLQNAILERVRSLGAGSQAVALTDDACAYLVAVIAKDLGLLAKFPEFKQIPPPFFGQILPQKLSMVGANFLDLYERLLRLNKDADTYFVCLAAMHKGRLKYNNILRTQPISNIEQVGPRGILQYGSLTAKALAGFLFWRKWFYDIDNRAAQETGYIFEPIIANAIGGTPAPAAKSPVKRRADGNKGRQVDCVKGKKAYEFKLRVTIAASGQGRWKEELDFARDCLASGYKPVLVVLDGTPNEKLTQLQKRFDSAGGDVYIGAAAWRHLEETAGRTMAKFLDKYVRDPLRALLAAAPTSLPKLTATMQAGSITISIDGESVVIARSSAAISDLEPDEMPEDAADQLPDA